MQLLNNFILVKPLPKQPELRLLNGQIISYSDLTEQERVIADGIINLEKLKDPQGSATYTGEVIALPEYLDNDKIHHGIYGDPVANRDTALCRAYRDILFDRPQLRVGDIIWFHYNTGENANLFGRVVQGRDIHRSLEPDTEYWLIEYTHFRSIYAFLRDGIITPLEYNIIVEPIIKERVSKLLHTPEKEKLKGKVVHAGKCGPIMHIEAGDTITHSIFSDIALRVDGKDLYVMDGLMDVMSVTKHETAAA